MILYRNQVLNMGSDDEVGDIHLVLINHQMRKAFGEKTHVIM